MTIWKTRTLFICCLLIGILAAHGLDAKKEESKVTPDDDTKATKSDTKDKRQIGSRDTATYSNGGKQDDPEQPQETIYGPKPGHFLIRPLLPHEQQLRNYQPNSRPQSQQLQALGPQLEQSQEIQHFAYLQDINRNHQAKTVVEGKSHTLPKKPSAAQLQQQYAGEGQVQHQLQQEAQQSGQLQAGPDQFRPSVYIGQQRAHPQQQQQQHQSQYQSFQEEHLLKLIEEELQARALQEAQARGSYAKPGPQSRPVPAERQGLNGYHSKVEESPEYAAYTQVQQQSGPLQGPQYLPLPNRHHLKPQSQAQIREPQAAGNNFYHGPSALSYRTIPNHPLAESSLEKEIEKLLASNRPAGYRHSQPPAVLSNRPSYTQQKSYSTTASPTTAVNQPSSYSFAPSIVQYSGFQPSPTAPSITGEHQQSKKFVPTAYSTTQPQYLIESPSPTKPTKLSPSSGQYRVKQQSQKSKPQYKQNLGPVQFYYAEPAQDNQQQQQQHQHTQPSQPPPDFHQYPIPSAAPSQSSIFVSQGTGIASPSQKIKVHGTPKPVQLPPPNGKPISQAEFQALIDAGYPVQAVPVPVPVPYEQYIKQHPEYVEIPHRHTQRGADDSGVTYLRPLPHERPRHPREQTEEAVAGKNPTS